MSASAVLWIATHPAIFKPPSPRDAVEAFIDTCLAALEHDCTYVTTDDDYARFTGLRWQHPID